MFLGFFGAVNLVILPKKSLKALFSKWHFHFPFRKYLNKGVRCEVKIQKGSCHQLHSHNLVVV